MKKFTLLAACSSGFIGAGWAQSSDEEVTSSTQEQSLDGTTVIAEKDRLKLEASRNAPLLGPVTEIPRSVAIITRDQIEERGALSVRDALGYTAGVFAAPFGLDSRLDDTDIRGITAQNYRDGFRSNYGFYNTGRSEVYGLDSVEVVKGASSVLYGQGALGGIVNTVSKLPQEVASNEVNLQYGSHDRLQAAFDFTGPINTGKTSDEKGQSAEEPVLFYRLVGLGRKSGTQVDWVNDDAWMIMPSLTWKPNENTEFTLLGNFQSNESGSTIQFYDLEDANLPGFNPSSSDFYGKKGWDKYDTDISEITLLFDHEINDIFSVSANGKYSSSSGDYRYLQPLPSSLTGSLGLPTPPTGELYTASYRDQSDFELWSGNVFMNADFKTGSVGHQLTFGVDYVNAAVDSNRPVGVLGTSFRGYNVLWTGAPFLSLPETIDMMNPSFNADIADVDYSNRISTNTAQTGIVLGDVMKFDKWILSGGLRYDFVDQEVTRNYDIAGTPGRKADQSDSELSFDAGLMYQFDNGITPYYSYSESFDPQGADARGVSYDPTTGQQHEIGLKYLSASGNTLVTAALFNMDESDRLVPVSGVSDVPVDVHYVGAEFEIQHRLQDFYFQAALSWIEAETGDDWKSDPTVGSKLPNVPEQQVSAWVTYDPQAGKLTNFRAGIGGRYVGKTYSLSNDLSTDSYALADAMIGYRFKDVDFQLNITNLFDKEYVAAYSEGALGIGQYFGSRRTVNLSATYHF